MLEIKNVNKVFHPGTPNEKVALDDLSLTLNDGDFVTLIGGNGAGKSTLMNVISGRLLPEEGQLLIDGVDITKMPEHKRAKFFGRVFQDPLMGTAANMQIDENLSIASKRGAKRGLRFGISNKEHEKYSAMLKELDLGLDTHMKKKVKLLSGGQRQALTLLMATMNTPELLLLDEHTAALDPKTSSKVLELTKKIVESNNITTLMITHNMYDAITYGNRLIMMNGGKIIFDVSGEEKKNLTVSALVAKFGNKAQEIVANDKIML